MKFTITIIALLLYMNLQSQDAMTELPYAVIPEAPETYTVGSVVSRMIDGLGFRYHWATDGLTEKDLNYRPGNDGRTIAETMEHIYTLSLTILKSAQKQARDFSEKMPEMNMDERRLATLRNLELASALFKTTEDLTEHMIIFKRGDNTSEFPFWNQINGPIEDAVYHTGQMVVLRRAAGNPINSKVNVFLGKLNE